MLLSSVQLFILNANSTAEGANYSYHNETDRKWRKQYRDVGHITTQ
jgi:hypothetical protein